MSCLCDIAERISAGNCVKMHKNNLYDFWYFDPVSGADAWSYNHNDMDKCQKRSKSSIIMKKK